MKAYKHKVGKNALTSKYITAKYKMMCVCVCDNCLPGSEPATVN